MPSSVDNSRQSSEAWRAHCTDVFGYCLRLCGDAHFAEDLASEATLRALRALQKLPKNLAVTDITAYSKTCAQHLFVDWLRSAEAAHRFRGDHQFDLDADNSATPAEAFDVDALGRMVDSAIAGLDDQERLIVILRRTGLKHREIAVQLGISEAAVRKAFSRTVQKLRNRPNER